MTQVPSQPLVLGTDMNHTMQNNQQRDQQEMGPHMVFYEGSSRAQSQTGITGNCALRLADENSSFVRHGGGSWLARCEWHSTDDGITLRCPVTSVGTTNMDLPRWLQALLSGHPHVPTAPVRGTAGVPSCSGLQGDPCCLHPQQ